MELSQRKQSVLKAVVEAYIDSGEPIGSKALCTILGTTLSPATLRNELSELCEMGYLSQPHTSAGRVPTNSAYRFYIESSLKHKMPPVRERAELDGLLREAAKDPMRIYDAAAQLLADFTGLPTVLSAAGGGGEYVKHLETVAMGRRTVMLILASSGGTTKCRFCRLDGDCSAGMLQTFARIAEEKILGKKIREITVPFLQGLTAAAGDYAINLLPLFAALAETAEEISNPRMSFGGSAYTLSARQAELIRFLNGINEDVDVVFGENTGISDLFPASSMVVARYSAGGNESGRIGVIGPVRMSYRRMMPSLHYFAERLSRVLEQNKFDLEE